MKQKRAAPPFFSKDEVCHVMLMDELSCSNILRDCQWLRTDLSHNRLQMLGVLLAAIMGLQHSLAMVGGLITPPLIVSSAANDVGITQVLLAFS